MIIELDFLEIIFDSGKEHSKGARYSTSILHGYFG